MAPPPGSHELVRVVQDFPGNNDGPMMFHPLTTPVPAVTVTIRSASGVGLAAGRLRAVAAGLGVGLFSVAGPARRAIRVDPTEALRVS